MRAGNLKQRVTIQTTGQTRDAAGQPSTGWIDYDTVWAGIRYLNGRQFLTANVEAASATVSIRMRYRADVTAAMRVVYGVKVFDIVAVLPDEADRDHIDLACTTGANNG